MPGCSPQEREVLTLFADGLTNRQIAERLYLAEKTIKNYVTSVLSKMGIAAAPRPRSTPLATSNTAIVRSCRSPRDGTLDRRVGTFGPGGPRRKFVPSK